MEPGSLIALVEIASENDRSASGADLRRVAEVAQRSGTRVYRVPVDFDEVGGPEAALWHVPRFEPQQAAVWVGFILQPQRYAALYRELLQARGLRLLNSPEEHLLAEEFERFYPRIAELTARSEGIGSIDECKAAAAKLGFPLFVKGSVQSLKVEGPGSCIARTLEELERITARLLRHPLRTRGRVVVREYLELRSDGTGPSGLPRAREFRVFLYRAQVLAVGYYWSASDPLAALRPDEREEVETLARTAAGRLGVPYLAVDVGQLSCGRWVVIEVGDAQFAGLSQVQPFQLWNRLVEAVRGVEPAGAPEP